MLAPHEEQELQIIEEENEVLLAAVLLLDEDEERPRIRRRKRRSCWVKPWLLRRPLYGHYENLIQELNREDLAEYRSFLCIKPEIFLELVDRVGPRIQKMDTNYREALEPGLKIAITLRYLASGNSYRSLQYSFRVASNTISLLVAETCAAIYAEYGPTELKCPKTPQEWKRVADDFAKKWNFHNCLGAVDGKHVAIRKPLDSGSTYYNYKGFCSIVLMAVTDAQYRFLFVDVGANGSCADAGIFKDTNLYRAVLDKTAGIPDPSPLPSDDHSLPYFFIADDAFALRTWMMKPYPSRGLSDEKRIFNYRLSRARRVVENSFGILAQR